MRKQNILNHLLVSTAVLGTMLIYQLPTVQAETISETSPSSLETNLPIASNTEAVKTTDETLSEQALDAEKPVNQDLPPENQVTTATPSPLVTEVSSSSEIDENKTVTPAADEAGNSSSETTPPVTTEQTSTSETTITMTEAVTPATATQQTETPTITPPQTETPAISDQEISPVTDTKTEEIQHSNVGENSVSITREQTSSNTVKWTVTFDPTNWGLSPSSVGAFYFFTPKNAKITSIVDHEKNQELIQHFSTRGLYKAYDETNPDEGLSKQWGWSVGNISQRDPRLDEWKNQGLFSKVFVLNERKDKGPISFTITATLPDDAVQSFPFVAVMKRYKYIAPTESTALAATTFEVDSKIILKPLFPKPAPETPTPPKTGGITITPLKPQVPKENPSEQIQVTFKEGKGGGTNPGTFTHYIYGGQIIKMINPGTPLKNILPTIKTALSGLKPQQGDLVLQKGYKVTGWVDEQNNRVSEDTIINQSIILSPVVEMAETEPNPPMPTPEKPKSEPEAPKVTPEKPKSEPEAPKVTPKKPKSEPEAPKATPEEPKKEPEAPKVTPEKPKTEPEAPKVTPEKPKSEPEAPKVTPEKPKSEPEAPKATPEKPKSEPEAPKVTPEKPKSEPEAPKVTPEKPKSEPEAPKVTPEKPKSEPEAPKVISQKTQTQGHSPKVSPNPPASTPTTTISETRKTTLPKTGEKSNVLAWLGGILAAILVGILALKPKNSKK